MKFLIKFIGIFLIVVSCKSGSETKKQENPNLHEVTVVEVMDAGGYTYLKVNQNGEEQWLAVNKMDAKKGETYYYEGGMTMENFESESLGKTFESIVFVDHISKEKSTMEPADQDAKETMAQHHADNLKAQKQAVEIEPAEDGITIGELYANKEKYKGKKVAVRGKVTKFNEAIMNTNWIHIQDGTEHDGEFDLTVKSDDMARVGDVIIVEGEIALDVDLGHGYAYDILMEDAVLKQ